MSPRGSNGLLVSRAPCVSVSRSAIRGDLCLVRFLWQAAPCTCTMRGESQAEKGRGEPPAPGDHVRAPPQPAGPDGCTWGSGGSGCQHSAPPRAASPAHLPGGVSGAQVRAVRVLPPVAKRRRTASSAFPALPSAPSFSALAGRPRPAALGPGDGPGGGRPENRASGSLVRMDEGSPPPRTGQHRTETPRLCCWCERA